MAEDKRIEYFIETQQAKYEECLQDFMEVTEPYFQWIDDQIVNAKKLLSTNANQFVLPKTPCMKKRRKRELQPISELESSDELTTLEYGSVIDRSSNTRQRRSKRSCRVSSHKASVVKKNENNIKTETVDSDTSSDNQLGRRVTRSLMSKNFSSVLPPDSDDNKLNDNSNVDNELVDSDCGNESPLKADIKVEHVKSGLDDNKILNRGTFVVHQASSSTSAAEVTSNSTDNEEMNPSGVKNISPIKVKSIREKWSKSARNSPSVKQRIEAFEHMSSCAPKSSRIVGGKSVFDSDILSDSEPSIKMIKSETTIVLSPMSTPLKSFVTEKIFEEDNCDSSNPVKNNESIVENYQTEESSSSSSAEKRRSTVKGKLRQDKRQSRLLDAAATTDLINRKSISMRRSSVSKMMLRKSGKNAIKRYLNHVVDNQPIFVKVNEEVSSHDESLQKCDDRNDKEKLSVLSNTEQKEAQNEVPVLNISDDIDSEDVVAKTPSPVRPKKKLKKKLASQSCTALTEQPKITRSRILKQIQSDVNLTEAKSSSNKRTWTRSRTSALNKVLNSGSGSTTRKQIRSITAQTGGLLSNPRSNLVSRINIATGLSSFIVTPSTPNKMTIDERETKKREQFNKRQKKIEDQRKKKEQMIQEKSRQAKLERETRIERVQQARKARQEQELKSKQQLEYHQVELSKRIEREKEEKLHEEQIKRQRVKQKEEEAKARRQQEEESRIAKVKKLEEERKLNDEKFQKKRALEEQERLQKLGELRRLQEDKQVQVEKERALQIQQLQKEQEQKDREVQERKAKQEREKEAERLAKHKTEMERLIQKKKQLEEQQEKKLAARKENNDVETDVISKPITNLCQQAILNSTYISETRDANTSVNKDDQNSSSSDTYEMTPPRSQQPIKESDGENYNIADLKSDDDTDDESNPRKKIPDWARGFNLKAALIQQDYRPPNLDKMFGIIEIPDLSQIFKLQRKRFFKRTSSAVWNSPIQFHQS